jgi:GntR family transcriptional repressor for pyruvate dehydrogenase complex
MVEPTDRWSWDGLSTRAVHVSDGLSAKLEAMIIEGTLEPGQRLPPEREFAAQLGVSRASVREALRDLELRGLIDRRPGRGTLVGDPARATHSGSLLARLTDAERTLAEVMDLRAAIEPPIAARAASRATEADVDRLSALVRGMESDPGSESVAVDVEFHQEIGRATHNSLLVKLVEVTSEWMGPSRSALQSEERLRASIAAHRRILDGIAAHDPAAAEEAMADHIAGVNALLAHDGLRPAR